MPTGEGLITLHATAPPQLQVLILIVQSANFIGVRESNKRSYRPGGDYWTLHHLMYRCLVLYSVCTQNIKPEVIYTRHLRFTALIDCGQVIWYLVQPCAAECQSSRQKYAHARYVCTRLTCWFILNIAFIIMSRSETVHFVTILQRFWRNVLSSRIKNMGELHYFRAWWTS